MTEKVEKHQLLILLTFRFAYGTRVIVPFAFGLSNISIGTYAIFVSGMDCWWTTAYSLIGYTGSMILINLLVEIKAHEVLLIGAIPGIGLLLLLGHQLRIWHASKNNI
jgi:membrane protein DedA with SNARE-associated domain